VSHFASAACRTAVRKVVNAMARRLGPEELEVLYARFAPVVHRRARMLLGRDADAWDVVQEVFERMLSAGAIREEASPMAYVYRVATNLSLNHLRARRIRERASPPEEEPSLPPADCESAQLLRTILEGLSPRQQEVAVLHFMDGMTQEEIATTLAVSRKTIVRDVAFIRERAAALSGESPARARSGSDG
jgi:RNA polymerase sigma-70 factor (ECF subfamily)